MTPLRSLLLSLALPAIACTSACATTPSQHPIGIGADDGSADGGHGDGGTSDDTGDDSSVVLISDTASSDTAPRPSRCDDAGNCSCITIASIGHEGVWGPCSGDSTTVFQSWLNSQSTAKVDRYDTKPTLTAEFLARYDVLILQWMVLHGKQHDDGDAWVFSSDEINVLKDWVNKGGGIIALSGYQCDLNGCTIYDTTATNQLLSFTDIQFNSDAVLNPSTAPYSGSSLNYCWGGPVPLGSPLFPDKGVVTAVGTWDPASPIGAHVNNLGSYVARSIKSTTASVDSKDATHTYAVHEEIGKGHVVAYGDEWITYSGEWAGTSSCLSFPYENPSDPCYHKSPVQVFQIAQFWYNAIKYAASSVHCFDIKDKTIIR